MQLAVLKNPRQHTNKQTSFPQHFFPTLPFNSIKINIKQHIKSQKQQISIQIIQLSSQVKLATSAHAFEFTSYNTTSQQQPNIIRKHQKPNSSSIDRNSSIFHTILNQYQLKLFYFQLQLNKTHSLQLLNHFKSHKNHATHTNLTNSNTTIINTTNSISAKLGACIDRLLNFIILQIYK